VYYAGQWEIWFLVLIVAEIAYSWIIVLMLRHAGFRYRLFLVGVVKCAAAGALCGLILAVMPSSANWAYVAIVTFLAFGITWSLTYILKPLNSDEQAVVPAKLLQTFVRRG
jgi:putative Ca2+/H+ antiporter (TMEM165/GDT1 family)